MTATPMKKKKINIKFIEGIKASVYSISIGLPEEFKALNDPMLQKLCTKFAFLDGSLGFQVHFPCELWRGRTQRSCMMRGAVKFRSKTRSWFSSGFMIPVLAVLVLDRLRELPMLLLFTRTSWFVIPRGAHFKTPLRSAKEETSVTISCGIDPSEKLTN